MPEAPVMAIVWEGADMIGREMGSGHYRGVLRGVARPVPAGLSRSAGGWYVSMDYH